MVSSLVSLDLKNRLETIIIDFSTNSTLSISFVNNTLFIAAKNNEAIVDGKSDNQYFAHLKIKNVDSLDNASTFSSFLYSDWIINSNNLDIMALRLEGMHGVGAFIFDICSEENLSIS